MKHASLHFVFASLVLSSVAFAGEGTINDLPSQVLNCVESVDGAIVQDGRVEVIIGKDQFGQLSAQVVQKDQFAGDSVLAAYPSIEAVFPNRHPLDIDARRPDVIYFANEGGVGMTLSLWDSTTTEGESSGKLLLTTEESFRSLEISCTK